MKKRTAGVITFHNYDNYGAILQSYGLQKKLKELGIDPEIIDYRCDYISNPFKLVNLKKKGLFNYIYGVIGHICYIPRRFRCNKFRRNMRYSEPVSRGRMDAVKEKYDMYIAGSDQIWDYTLTNSDTTYFLDFVAGGRKKYSYAASFGEHLPSSDQLKKRYGNLLRDFDEILVRESSGVEFVEEILDRKPGLVCDPTLLLDAGDWEPLVKEPKNKTPYILVYQLGINKEVVDFVRRLARKTGLRVVYIPFPLVGLMKCSCKIAVGPAEWMGLFKNAEYVVSDSFHGIVFSLIFNRKFFAMVNGHHVNKRAEQLLRQVKLSHRTIDQATDRMLTEKIDFTYANEQLAMIRKESFEALKKMVEK